LFLPRRKKITCILYHLLRDAPIIDIEQTGPSVAHPHTLKTVPAGGGRAWRARLPGTKAGAKAGHRRGRYSPPFVANTRVRWQVILFIHEIVVSVSIKATDARAARGVKNNRAETMVIFL